VVMYSECQKVFGISDKGGIENTRNCDGARGHSPSNNHNDAKLYVSKDKMFKLMSGNVIILPESFP